MYEHFVVSHLTRLLTVQVVRFDFPMHLDAQITNRHADGRSDNLKIGFVIINLQNL